MKYPGQGPGYFNYGDDILSERDQKGDKLYHLIPPQMYTDRRAIQFE